MAAEDAEEPEDYARACEDRKANGDAADTDADGVVAVDVEGLSGPEHNHTEEVGATYESDDEGEGEDAWFLLEARRKHRVFRAVDFPDAEGD